MEIDLSQRWATDIPYIDPNVVILDLSENQLSSLKSLPELSNLEKT